MGSVFIVRDGIMAWYEETDITEDAQEEFESAAQSILDYAKANAPWADRTGNAREGLDTQVFIEGDQVILELYHTVDYGQWLETIQGGEFAIIMPTLEIYAPTVFASVAAKITDHSGEDFS